MLVTAGPVTQHHIPEDVNLQQHDCESLRSNFRNDVWRNLRVYTDCVLRRNLTDSNILIIMTLPGS